MFLTNLIKNFLQWLLYFWSDYNSGSVGLRNRPHLLQMFVHIHSEFVSAYTVLDTLRTRLPAIAKTF
jgi:hypothetical protein